MWAREKRKENWRDFHVCLLSVTFCHVSFSNKAWNVICQTSMRGPTGFGATSLTALLNVHKHRGCREEQSGADDTLRSLLGWVGIVMPLTFGKWNENAKRAGIVIYCAPKFSAAVGGAAKTCMLDFWVTKQVFAFHVSVFQVGLRDPQGCCETNREINNVVWCTAYKTSEGWAT